ncbi:MAG: YtxH domain-containing protein [Elusimicrobia bacterium]|nr:YtxH domain-containing protein [Elusimicrobiota bacterium]
MAREDGVGLVWFLLGGAIGAGAALLLAPRSGKETREQLGDWLASRRERGGELLQRITESVPEKKEQFVAAAKAAKQAYNDTKHHAGANTD